MIEALKKNDKVLTAGGIYGTVVSVDPARDRVVLRVDDDKGVKLTIQPGERRCAGARGADGEGSGAVVTPSVVRAGEDSAGAARTAAGRSGCERANPCVRSRSGEPAPMADSPTAACNDRGIRLAAAGSPHTRSSDGCRPQDAVGTFARRA